jgi:hypothetical protein
MSKAVTSLKYMGAVIIFVVSSMICSVIAHLGIRLVNFDAKGFWIDFLPYFVAFMAGYISVLGGLSAVERVFSTVRLRTVAWIFIVTLILFWAPPVIGLLLGFVGILNFPLESHTLLSAETPPQLLQTLVAGVAVWKMTAADGDFGSAQ